MIINETTIYQKDQDVNCSKTCRKEDKYIQLHTKNKNKSDCAKITHTTYKHNNNNRKVNENS